MGDADPQDDGTGDDAVAAVSEALGELFRLAGSRRIHEGRAQRSRTDLTRTGWEFLRRIDRYGPVSVTELADQLEQSLGTTSRTLRDLEAQGLVRARPDVRDARVVRFTLSPKGRRVHDRYRRTADADLAHALRDWSERDRRQLARLLERLNHSFRTPVPAPPATTTKDQP